MMGPNVNESTRSAGHKSLDAMLQATDAAPREY